MLMKSPIICLFGVLDVFFESCLGPVAPPPIEALYEPTIPPSRITISDIKKNQLDDRYYSPCANTFTLVAHRLAYENLPRAQSSRLTDLIEMTLSDMEAAVSGSDPLGYCSQRDLDEESITALLTANISLCFSEYCRCRNVGNDVEDRVSIMNQSTMMTKAGKASMDISLFYRFLKTDEMFVHRGCAALFPLLFMTFTTTANSTIEEKRPQAALYANHLFRLMDFDKCRTWVPLLGIVISQNEMLVRLYSPSVVENKWKIAEVDVMICEMTPEAIERLLSVMMGWTMYCTQFLRSPAAQPPLQSLNPHLLLRQHCNLTVLGKKIFKSYDYRDLSDRSNFVKWYRRDPKYYHKSDLPGVELLVDWASDWNCDCLQILSYDMIPGVHYPSTVGHLILAMRKVAQLHAEGIVHGDLRLANILFSEAKDANVASTIIDFDHSGPAGERIYPWGFNYDIPDGFRHPEARADEFLRPEHDIAALHWICAQYHPKAAALRETWSTCLTELLNGALLSVADCLVLHQFEELEPVNKNLVVSVAIKGAGH